MRLFAILFIVVMMLAGVGLAESLDSSMNGSPDFRLTKQGATDDLGTWEGRLRPTTEAATVSEKNSIGIPFYQGIPVVRGALFPSQIDHPSIGLLDGGGQPVPAVISAASFWPDGSISWLAVDGIWSQKPSFEIVQKGFPISVGKVCDSTQSIDPCESDDRVPPPVDGLTVKDGRVIFLDQNGQEVVSLSPRASYIEIKEPKVIIPDSVPDDERQYEWAQPIQGLNKNAEPKPLDLRVRDHIVEEENDVYTVYRVRGDGGAAFPGSGLEWQLRVRIYRHTPVVRMQMSWGLHWEPTRFALTQAEWVAQFQSKFIDVAHAGAEVDFDLGAGAVVLRSDPTGRSALSHGDKVISNAEWPNHDWEVTVVNDQDYSLGIGIPNLTRLGPNHFEINGNSLTFASWSGRSGYGLDLRQSAEPDEFQRNAGDHQSQAIGVMRTLEASLVWSADAGVAFDLARLEARRDTLWFPSREDLLTAQIFGPIPEQTFINNKNFFEDLRLRVHFIKASQDHWRWNGWINYGDVRTNFSRTSVPERGLHPGRWSLHGRYGWRNGSMEPYYGFWLTGLLLEDRELAMMAMDYALHVTDVDVAHGSFFGSRRRESGGIHRRNKDHWSGSVQMQYTMSRGLYLTQWLTGHERVKETLEEVRGYAASQKGTGSVFAASAWISRFMETHDPKDLEFAKELLDASVSAWERAGRPREEHLWGNPAPNANLKGLAALYKNNFRLPLDGIPVLIQFHQATDDPIYLETIATMMQAHGVPREVNHGLSNYAGLAYLLANGYTEEQIGTELVQIARDHVTHIVNSAFPLAKDQWNYESLATFVGSLGAGDTGWRGAAAPLVIRYFGRPPVAMQVVSPRKGETIIGTLPVRVQLQDPPFADEIESVMVSIDGTPVYSKAGWPGSDDIVVDTKQFNDGSKTLTVSVVHPEFGLSQQTVTFNVSNTWTLVQNMAPPVTQGWFGVTDFLTTVDRSDGWTYETGNSDVFFGDAQRLVRGADSSQYAVWEAPHLFDAVVTVFVRSGTEWSHGIQLAVSKGDSEDSEWQELVPEVHVQEGKHGWTQVRLTTRVDDLGDKQLFRVILTDSVPKDEIQIGEVVLRGSRS